MAIVLNAILSVALVGCVAYIYRLRQDKRHAEGRHKTWTVPLESLLQLIADAVKKGPENANLVEQFADFLSETLHADGVVVLRHRTENDSTTIETLLAKGICERWSAGSEGATSTIETVPNDFFWSRRPQIYASDALAKWLPDVPKDVGDTLFAPILLDNGEAFYALVRENGERRFTGNDQDRLATFVTFCEVGCASLRSERQRRETESALNKAHEEGMLQISTGIIHNIGNIITTIQLALDRLQTDSSFASCGEVSTFIGNEIIPELERQLEAQTIQSFLQSDPQGQEYLGSLTVLNTEIEKSINSQMELVEFIATKFKHLTDIINLQQQFIGELGTENVVNLSSIIEDVRTFCDATIEQRGIQLQTSFEAKGQILVDPAMLRHVMLLLFKLAIDSVTASQKSKPLIEFSSTSVTVEEKDWFQLHIKDNGSGASIREDLGDQRSRDYDFCRRRITKYGGEFRVDADYISGTTVVVELPEFKKKSDTATEMAGSPDEYGVDPRDLPDQSSQSNDNDNGDQDAAAPAENDNVG